MSDYYTEASLAINEALGTLDADLKGCTPSMLVSALEQRGYQIARLPSNPSQQERDSLDHSFYSVVSTPNPTHIDVIAKHADFVGGDSIRHCSCGRWHSTDGQGQHSRLAHAEHVVSKLTDAGYSIIPSGDVQIQWAARIVGTDDLIECNSEQGAIEMAADNRAWLSTRPREVLQRTVIHTDWAAAAAEGEKP